MKNFDPITFDPKICFEELNKFKEILDSKAELEEAKDILPFLVKFRIKQITESRNLFTTAQNLILKHTPLIRMRKIEKYFLSLNFPRAPEAGFTENTYKSQMWS